MRTRTKIVTFTLAMLLVGSVVYAADKRRPAKLDVQEPDPTHEEEALKAELLAASEDHQESRKTVAGLQRIVDDKVDTDKADVKTTEH